MGGSEPLIPDYWNIESVTGHLNPKPVAWASITFGLNCVYSGKGGGSSCSTWDISDLTPHEEGRRSVSRQLRAEMFLGMNCVSCVCLISVKW
jgi:hypothetical protein